jgi:group II intron reverse transcriptase/maturase
MIDYHETKSQPISRFMVLQAYREVRANKGSGGVDEMTWTDLEAKLPENIYLLWNRLSSGSYFPKPVKQVEIAKKDGGIRKLGIPTLLDRIAQQVVRAYLEPKLDPLFHPDSYAYRKGRNAHQAIAKAQERSFNHDWILDLDIRKFFDTIDHKLLLKALKHYCNEAWVLMYVERWLKAGIVTKEGMYTDSLTGTPQGGVISPLLANLYLHVVFDKWMQVNHPEKPFERYADDIIVHCKSDKQAKYMLNKIGKRLKACKLTLHPEKTKIVNLRGRSEKKYPRSCNFLGFTLKPVHTFVKKSQKFRTIPMAIMSREAKSSVLKKLSKMQIHKRRKPIEQLADDLRPVLQGVINYFCKTNSVYTWNLWYAVNQKLLKWVKWEKGLSLTKAIRWLRSVWKRSPNLFPHWKLAHP